MVSFAYGQNEEVKGKYAGVMFHERFDAPGLQAADLYTHCWYRYAADESQRGPRYEALDRLTEKAPGMKYYSKDHIQGLFRNMPPSLREAVRNWSE